MLTKPLRIQFNYPIKCGTKTNKHITIDTSVKTNVAADPQSLAIFAKGWISKVHKSTAASIAVLISSLAKITPNAINNYVRLGVMPAPVKKKYYKLGKEETVPLINARHFERIN